MITALYVEDDVKQFDLVKRVLKGAGIRLRGASTINEGEQRVRAQSFDVVILDLNLGASQGIETFYRIRDAMGQRRSQIVVYAGIVDQELTTKLYAERAFKVLEKGSDPEQLIEAVLDAAAASVPSGPVRRDSPPPVGTELLKDLWEMVRDMSEDIGELKGTIPPIAKQVGELERDVTGIKSRLAVTRAKITGIVIGAGISGATIGKVVDMAFGVNLPEPPPVAAQQPQPEQPRWRSRGRDPSQQPVTNGGAGGAAQ